MQEKIAEFESRLSKFATSEEEDGMILADSSSDLDWISRRIIGFRRERKRAIRLTIERLKQREKTAYSLLSTTAKAQGIAGKEEL